MEEVTFLKSLMKLTIYLLLLYLQKYYNYHFVLKHQPHKNK